MALNNARLPKRVFLAAACSYDSASALGVCTRPSAVQTAKVHRAYIAAFVAFASNGAVITNVSTPLHIYKIHTPQIYIHHLDACACVATYCRAFGDAREFAQTSLNLNCPQKCTCSVNKVIARLRPHCDASLHPKSPTRDRMRTAVCYMLCTCARARTNAAPAQTRPRRLCAVAVWLASVCVRYIYTHI